MDQETKEKVLAIARTAHDLTEASYQKHPASRDDPAWFEKQRILLADMSLHLLQTALRDGELSEDHLKRNLFAILTIADQFVEGQDLKSVADKLYTS